MNYLQPISHQTKIIQTCVLYSTHVSAINFKSIHECAEFTRQCVSVLAGILTTKAQPYWLTRLSNFNHPSS